MKNGTRSPNGKLKQSENFTGRVPQRFRDRTFAVMIAIQLFVSIRLNNTGPGIASAEWREHSLVMTA